MADGLALLRLMAWLSPAFPVGGYAYSSGLEWSVEAGDVTDGASLQSWLEDFLAHGAPAQDAILLRAAWRAEQDLEALADFAAASALTAERGLETEAQGEAFRLAAAAWPIDWPERTLAYPLAVGLLARAQGIGEDDAALAFLHAAVANLISAAVRLVPLGQSAGLAVMAALEPAILAAERRTRDAVLEDCANATFRAEIAAMRHETQYTRLFRT